ncbi:MAG: metallophosphoesterase [Oscillospiraceae bacterium]|nr:metallophosphoesterase [Oscillospiraceae bacterium]
MIRKALSFALVLLLLLPGCAARERAADCDIAVAADLHYISPALTDGGAAFSALVDEGDGKLMHEIEALSEAFLDEVIALRPEALLLLGDLTFNGALESHRALAEKLRRVEEAGVPVLVTTGNHDLDNPSAAAFSGERYRRVPSADSAAFRRIYAAFGYDEALSLDADSLSYVYPLNDTTRVLMLDFNTAAHPCGLSESTLLWVREQLRAAKKAEQRVLAAGHQNLMQQSIFREGYVIDRADELLGLFARYDVPLFLSGHLHAQRWRTEQGVTEIAASALSVFPCQYGLLRAQGGRITYDTRQTDVAAWAEGQGRTEPELLDFAAHAAACFDARSRRQLPEALAPFGYPAEQIERMTESFCALNRASFSGDLRDVPACEAAAALWEDDPSLYGLYVRSLREDFGKDFRHWDSASP